MLINAFKVDRKFMWHVIFNIFSSYEHYEGVGIVNIMLQKFFVKTKLKIQ